MLSNAFDLQTALAAIGIDIPVITKIVGDYAWERARRNSTITDDLDTFQTETHSRRIQCYKRLRTFQTRRMDHVVVPSEYLRDIVTGWGIPEDQTSVIYNAIDIDAPTIPKSDCKERIITVGRLVNWKGIDGIIDAFTSLATKRSNLECHIVGDGPKREALEQHAANTTVGNRIVFHGRVAHDRVLKLVANSRAFVLNSTYEGLPHVVLEAMAGGTPVVASAAGGTPEVVTDEQTGLLVDPTDTAALTAAIERVLDDGSLRSRLRTNAYAQLDEQFDHDRMIDEYESLLTRIARR